MKHLPKDSLSVLQGAPNGGLGESRSLAFDRYAEPELKEKPRFEALARRARIPANTAMAARRFSFLMEPHGPLSRRIHARTISRLILNLSGSVVENAGLSLDRLSGAPFMPGSAVKGLARRTALRALREWSTYQAKPVSTHPLSLACSPFSDVLDMFQCIVRVFGATDIDWTSKQDLCWALGGPESAAWTSALAANRGLAVCAGSVSFLAAYPTQLDMATNSALEVDVLTPHHKRYYRQGGVATDDENPEPSTFPAIAANQVFTFVLRGSSNAAAADVEVARDWLRIGLTILGAGAKVAAGYGWFEDITDETESKLRDIQARAEQAAREHAVKIEALKLAAEKAESERARAARRAAMTPEQIEDDKLRDLMANKGQFKQHLERFEEHPQAVKEAIVRWLSGTTEGLAKWAEIKTAKKPWPQLLPKIHQVKNQLRLKLP